MTKAIRMYETGGPEVLLCHEAIGLNFIDVYHRTGLYPSSGPVALFDLSILGAKGSLFLTRPSLMTYTAKRGDLLAHAQDLFEVVEKGAVKIEIRQTYPLADVAQAHRDLEGRTTTGSTILIPE